MGRELKGRETLKHGHIQEEMREKQRIVKWGGLRGSPHSKDGEQGKKRNQAKGGGAVATFLWLPRQQFPCDWVIPLLSVNSLATVFYLLVPHERHHKAPHIQASVTFHHPHMKISGIMDRFPKTHQEPLPQPIHSPDPEICSIPLCQNRHTSNMLHPTLPK